MSTDPEGQTVANPPKEGSPKQSLIPIEENILPVSKSFLETQYNRGLIPDELLS